MRLQITTARGKGYNESCPATERAAQHHRQLLATTKIGILTGDHLSEKRWMKCLRWKRDQAKRLLKLFLTLTLYDLEILAGYIHMIHSPQKIICVVLTVILGGKSSSKFIP